jgi:UDP-glucose:(heptosyl)LPS alpha-1,3-glucosyltransferase
VKVALICRPFSFHGGIETVTAGLMGELVRRGYELELLTTAGQPPVPGVTVRSLPVIRQPSVLRLLSFGLAAALAVHARDYDIVQSHERCFRQDIYRAGEGTHRGYLEALGRRSAAMSPYHRVVLALERRIFRLKGTRHIVANSRQAKGEIERLYGTPQVSLVYNGVDLARFNPDNRVRLRSEVRDRWGLPREAWVVVFIGSGFERKGLGPLIEGVSRLRDPQMRLVVAGKGRTGPYAGLAARLGVSDRVRWMGPRRDVECLYAAADVVAVPSLYDPFPNVLLEGLASGVPGLASARTGGAELIHSGDNGWVVEECTGAAVAGGLEALRSLDPLEVGARARALAERFTYAAQVEALAGIYRQLAR